MKDELFAMTFREFCKGHDISLKSMEWGVFSGLDIVCRFKGKDTSEFRIHARKPVFSRGIAKLTIKLRKSEQESTHTTCLAKGMALAYMDDKAMGILYDFLRMYGCDDSPLFSL